MAIRFYKLDDNEFNELMGLYREGWFTELKKFMLEKHIICASCMGSLDDIVNEILKENENRNSTTT